MIAKTRILSLILVVISIGFVTSCTGGSNPTTSTTPPTTTNMTTTAAPSVDDGRNIYKNANSLSGDPIYQTNGVGMMYFSCESCHGPDAHGGNIFLMMQTYEVPNITWAVLTGPNPDHPPYTVDTFKQAVTKGIDPAGDKLEYPMPIWTISDRDLNDLISYLQTLP